MALLTGTELYERIESLAALERPSASPGEEQAARQIAERLRVSGAAARLERESVHGTYWWPIGLLTGAAGLAGLTRSRLATTLLGAVAALGVIDDITGGRRWLRRSVLPARTTTNVVAEIGPRDAARTVLLCAHHDAAHSGLVFDPELPRRLLRRFPAIAERANTTPPTMWGAVAGPALVAIGGALGNRKIRRLGASVCAGYAAAMLDIGMRDVVPGANDNLTGVAVLLSVAAALGADPPDDVRLILLSTGAEESLLEGMQAYAERHFDSLPRDTEVICVDTVGSPHLLALEGEGMVWMNEYPAEMLRRTHRAAEEEGIDLWDGLRFRNATDGLIALRAGFPTVTLGSVDEHKIPTDYHWPTDTADRVDLTTVADCARLCLRLIAPERAEATASPHA